MLVFEFKPFPYLLFSVLDLVYLDVRYIDKNQNI